MSSSGPLRIAWLCQHFPERSGGAEIFAERMSGHWRSQGHHVEILSATSNAENPFSSPSRDIPVTNLPVSPRRFLGTLQLVLRVSHWLNQNAERFDVVLVSLLKHMAYAALGQHRLPVVLRAEGAGLTGDVAWQRGVLGGGWVRSRCKRANALVAVSPAIEEELRDAGYPTDCVRRISNGVPLPEAPWSKEDTHRWRRTLDLPDRPTLTYVGRLTVEKGIDRFRALANALRARGHAWNFLIVGEGPGFGPQLVKEGFFTTGFVRDVEPYLRASDLFLLPSEFEGLSLTLLEALALGMPVLASDIPANRRIAPAEVLPLRPLDRGLESWIPWIEQILADGNSPANPSEGVEARRRVIKDRYSLAACADAHIALLREVIASKSRKG